MNMKDAIFPMNLHVLRSMASTLEAPDIEFETEEMYQWLRSRFTAVTAAALYGEANPFTRDPQLIETYWYDHARTRPVLPHTLPPSHSYLELPYRTLLIDSLRTFANNHQSLLHSPIPSLFARSAYAPRRTCQAALRSYWPTVLHQPDVSTRRLPPALGSRQQ